MKRAKQEETITVMVNMGKSKVPYKIYRGTPFHLHSESYYKTLLALAVPFTQDSSTRGKYVRWRKRLYFHAWDEDTLYPQAISS